MVTSHTLESNNLPSGKGAYNIFKRFGKPGPTDRTGDRLGVKSSVQWVFVLSAAIRTHLEFGHGGERTVVGQSLDESVTRSAMRAIGERVEIAPIGRVENFLETLLTTVEIRRDPNPGAMGSPGLQDNEALALLKWHPLLQNTIDHSSRWRLLHQTSVKLSDPLGRPLYLNKNASGIVTYEAGKV